MSQINGFGGNNPLNRAQQQKTQQSQDSQGINAGATVKSNTDQESSSQLKVSAEAKLMQAFHAATTQAPDIDQGKVDAIRSALEEGSYQIDFDQLANKMIASGKETE
ncbi:flagellar biosynthesis anti-sigma factor FlgM [Pelagibaculum spongiae]|uniref:Negative regulator of flagellin synthesis n=1 Tax=Pelagibaculum spongiae TaxID=2080658 RepID=A0A2V1GU04_9GAMM|nr:flagellar biosynthesis anti-sigma factor FlgM [Pelagibaculum spongiae]PVZ66751.1 flagellar biosynthesis anti-sigma factor FlgM [Pelagibaculum spongiae]